MALGTLLPLVGGLLCALLLYAVLFIGRREKGLPPGTCFILILILIISFTRCPRFDRWTDSIPGPPTAPIIGNIHQIPTKGSYLK